MAGEEADSGSISLRRKPLVDVFSRRGAFSPLAASPRRSEIPRNTLEIEPSDALFGGRDLCGCGYRRWYRRHSRVISSCVTGCVCVTVIALLIASVTYHLTQTYGSTSVESSSNVYIPSNSGNHHDSDTHPAFDEFNKLQIMAEDEDVDGGQSVESLAPLEAQPPRERIVAHVLEDSREKDDWWPPAGLLALQLTRAKMRYRRSLPKYYANRHYVNPDCSGNECDDVGAANPNVRSKWDVLLRQIREIKRKLRQYEMSLTRYTKTPFRDYSLSFPTGTRRIRPSKVTLPYLPFTRKTSRKSFEPIKQIQSFIGDEKESSSASPAYSVTFVLPEKVTESSFPDTPDLVNEVDSSADFESTEEEKDNPLANYTITLRTFDEKSTVSAVFIDEIPEEVTLSSPKYVEIATDPNFPQMSYSTIKEITNTESISWTKDQESIVTDESTETEDHVQQLYWSTTTSDGEEFTDGIGSERAPYLQKVTAVIPEKEVTPKPEFADHFESSTQGSSGLTDKTSTERDGKELKISAVSLEILGTEASVPSDAPTTVSSEEVFGLNEFSAEKDGSTSRFVIEDSTRAESFKPPGSDVTETSETGTNIFSVGSTRSSGFTDIPDTTHSEKIELGVSTDIYTKESKAETETEMSETEFTDANWKILDEDENSSSSEESTTSSVSVESDSEASTFATVAPQFTKEIFDVFENSEPLTSSQDIDEVTSDAFGLKSTEHRISVQTGLDSNLDQVAGAEISTPMQEWTDDSGVLTSTANNLFGEDPQEINKNFGITEGTTLLEYDLTTPHFEFDTELSEVAEDVRYMNSDVATTVGPFSTFEESSFTSGSPAKGPAQPTTGKDNFKGRTDEKMRHNLEDEIFADNQGPIRPLPSSSTLNAEDDVKGVSLEDARNRKIIDEVRKKWGSRVVGSSSDVRLPTGPDAALDESLKTGQQLTIFPNTMPHIVIPYQMCFYANPNSKGMPTIRDESQPRTFDFHSLNMQPFALPSLKITPAPAPSLLPQPNTFNIYMNNNPPPTMPHMPLSAPGILTFPSQQHMARYMNGQHQALFCSAIQGPLYQFPTVPGTTEFGHARCLNCDDPDMVKTDKDNASAQRETGRLVCPDGLSRCQDDQLCIPVVNWCDGRVHCADASDELHCGCADRLADGRRCDGYVDCPEAEDEANCFDCPITSFSCGSWDQEGACIALSKRCDGTSDCVNGRDEVGCSFLTPNLTNASEHTSYAEGFLMRSWRGQWYPVCSENGRQVWAEEACAAHQSTASGDIEVEQREIPSSVAGPFITNRADGDLVLEHHCKGHVGLHVTCARERCGTRVVDEDRTEFVSRFRRLVEQRDSPAMAADRPFLAWWDRVKEEVASRFNVEDVIARLVPLENKSGRAKSERPAPRRGRRSRRKEKRGRRQGAERVVGGRASSPHSWPWAVALYKNGAFHCGGVLLDRHWLLTAAHCVTKYWEHYYEVRIGMLRRLSFAPMEQVRNVANVVLHEKYDPGSMKNDLAALRVEDPVLFGQWVRPACLPVRGRASREGPWAPAPGSRCVAIGWGAIREHGLDPDQLREVEVPILERCKHREDVEGDEICAGLKEGGKDTCQGDSGGPLMCRDSSSEGAWYVAGVVSHGEGCARPNEAGAYTRVSLYVDWLASHTTDQLPHLKPQTKCPGFKCTSHPRLCISAGLRCNGIVNCLGGEDEYDCHHERSSASERLPSTSIPQQILHLKREPPPLEEPIFNYTVPDLLPRRFQCRTCVQSVAGSRRCDGIQDCEDATDEVGCSCRDIISRSAPHRLCDGIAHCADLTDELSCFSCPDGYFNCRRSRQCVSMDRKCDQKPDCVHEEDESDCYGLSKKLNLVVDENGELSYETKGYLIENQRGRWSVVCVNRSDAMSSKPASEVCRHLGLIGFTSYHQVSLGDVILRVTDHSSAFLSQTDTRSSSHCTGVRVECSKQIGSAGDAKMPNTWEVVIWVNGEGACTAVLLTDQWVLSSQHCLQNFSSLETSYVAAEVNRQTYPPTVVRVDNIQTIESTDIIMLHLEFPVNTSRQLRPIQVPYWKPTKELEHCQAMGGNTTLSVSLTDDCGPKSVCAARGDRPSRRCRSSSWVGVVVCYSENGWMPAAVFREMGGACGFQSSNFTNVLLYVKEINSVVDGVVVAANEVPCNGMRCLGGLCISPDSVCDGWPHCPFGDDEDEAACENKDYTNECHRHELRCADGTCIPRVQFGDVVRQCPDGSDEPDIVTCASYLQLTAPWRICDGTRNCLDKSDEYPALCNGKGGTFNCTESNVWIADEFVCDGQEDCPHGEEEKHCIGLQKVARLSKEYEYRNMSYGVWHSVCGATPTQREADALCVGVGHEMAASVKTKSMLPRNVVLDHFSAVNLNNVTKLAVRGDRAFVTLRLGSKPCPIAFVTCH